MTCTELVAIWLLATKTTIKLKQALAARRGRARWLQSSGSGSGKYGRSSRRYCLGPVASRLRCPSSTRRSCGLHAEISDRGWPPTLVHDRPTWRAVDTGKRTAEAQRLLGSVASKADPAAEKRTARGAQTVSQLCDLYLADAESGRLVTRRRAPKKASTLDTDRGRIERHIKPLLGRRSVVSVTRDDIEGFMHDVATGKTAGKTKTKARDWRVCAAGKGPRAARWACWARSSPTRFDAGYARTILFKA